MVSAGPSYGRLPTANVHNILMGPLVACPPPLLSPFFLHMPPPTRSRAATEISPPAGRQRSISARTTCVPTAGKPRGRRSRSATTPLRPGATGSTHSTPSSGREPLAGSTWPLGSTEEGGLTPPLPAAPPLPPPLPLLRLLPRRDLCPLGAPLRALPATEIVVAVRGAGWQKGLQSVVVRVPALPVLLVIRPHQAWREELLRVRNRRRPPVSVAQSGGQRGAGRSRDRQGDIVSAAAPAASGPCVGAMEARRCSRLSFRRMVGGIGRGRGGS